MLAALFGEEFSLPILRTVSPSVEILGEGQFLIEYTGSELLPSSTKGQIGIASCRFVAECAARAAPLGGCLRIEKGREAHFLAPFPITWLPATEETARRLELLGVTTLGQLARLGKDPLYQQFGEEGLLLWELALGIDERPLIACRDPELPEVVWDFDTPCSGGPWLQTTLTLLIERLWERLRGLSCMGLRMDLMLEEGESVQIDLRFAVGTTRSEVAARHAWRKVESCSLSARITAIRLCAMATAPVVAGELSLFASKRARHWPNLREQLKAKGKGTALMQIRWVDPVNRLPERRAYLQSLLYDRVRRPLYRPRHVRVAVKSGRVVAVDQRAVNSVLDEWDLVEDWWTSQPIERRYFRLCLTNGAYLRLFCERGTWFRQ